MRFTHAKVAKPRRGAGRRRGMRMGFQMLECGNVKSVNVGLRDKAPLKVGGGSQLLSSLYVFQIITHAKVVDC